eukprot:3368336-Pleurochrysis_carterae.AAC.2
MAPCVSANVVREDVVLVPLHRGGFSSCVAQLVVLCLLRLNAVLDLESGGGIVIVDLNRRGAAYNNFQARNTVRWWSAISSALMKALSKSSFDRKHSPTYLGMASGAFFVPNDLQRMMKKVEEVSEVGAVGADTVDQGYGDWGSEAASTTLNSPRVDAVKLFELPEERRVLSNLLRGVEDAGKDAAKVIYAACLGQVGRFRPKMTGPWSCVGARSKRA